MSVKICIVEKQRPAATVYWIDVPRSMNVPTATAVHAPILVLEPIDGG